MAFILNSFPPTKIPKEGEITYRPVSRFNACVCAFFIEANSFACKRLADRDPVLHDSQFAVVQISWLQSMHKHYSLWKRLPNSCLFKRKKIQVLSGLQLKEETKNPFLHLGGSQTWMNENVDLHFSHTDKGWMSFSLLWCRKQAVVSCLRIGTFLKETYHVLIQEEC